MRIGDGSLGVNQPSHRPRADKRINRRDFDLASVPPSVPDRPTVPEPGDDDRTTGSRDYEGYLDILILDSGLLFDPLTDVEHFLFVIGA